MKHTFTHLLLIFILFGIVEVKAQVTLPCIDNSIIDIAFTCPAVVDSVWGCDGNCYLNPCEALFHNGVTHFTHDACNISTPLCHADFIVDNLANVISFYDSSFGASGNPLSYLYDFGDGDTAMSAYPSHMYNSAGYYLVTLTIDDPGFCTSTTSKYIFVAYGWGGSGWNNFYNFITATNPNCTNNGALTANTFNGTPPFTYLWSNGGTDSTITGLGAGNYVVTVTDDSGFVTTGSCNLYSSCTNILEGNLFNDANGNCILDGGETPLQYVYVSAYNGSNYYYGNVDANGNYSINIPAPGTYTISAYSWSYGYGLCGTYTPCVGNTVTFPSVGDTSTGNNIGFSASTAHDLGIFATWTGANPGFQMHYNFFPYDFSVPTFPGLETVTFHYDPQLVYDSSNNAQVAHNSATHTLTHVGINAPNWYFGAPPIVCYFTVPVSTPTNYLVQSDFYINPTTNDCDTTNNHLHTSGIVTGSYDPNEKTVSPAGNILNTDSVLTYTIHFQNTGNDTTHFVIVTDTLPSSLDPTTVVNLASSAPFSDISISGSGILKWVFNPMFLPDSASNEPASKGFVMFKIKVKPNLPVGTEIKNKASIFFDYNTAVITNYASNSLINGVEELSVVSSQVSVFPNPANEQITISSNKQNMNTIIITDVLGREIFNDKLNLNSKSYKLTALSKGIYFVKVQMQNSDLEVKRFVKE